MEYRSVHCIFFRKDLLFKNLADILDNWSIKKYIYIYAMLSSYQIYQIDQVCLLMLKGDWDLIITAVLFFAFLKNKNMS